MSQAGKIELSICIATYNRAQFIAETIDCILREMEPGVELVIVDGASQDNTGEVIAGYLQHHSCIRYYRERENSGIDRDYDKAVSYARGSYCWLMTDDDLLHPGAVRRVLAAIHEQHDLIVVNAEIRNANLSQQLRKRRLPVTSDQYYASSNEEPFFSQAASYLSFIGCVVIRRDSWLARDRSTYYGTLFIHVGVIFQNPPLRNVLVISAPLIIIRYGNAMWTSRGFEIWMFKWPQLVWSFPGFSDRAKRSVCRQEPWLALHILFHYRATGAYSSEEYRKFLSNTEHRHWRLLAWLIGRFPAALANFILVVYCTVVNRGARMALYELLCSRHASDASRTMARIFGPVRVCD